MRYAFQTSQAAPTVLDGARRPRIPRPTLVSDTTMTQFDPLTALTEQNTFARNVTPFLRHLVKPPRSR